MKNNSSQPNREELEEKIINRFPTYKMWGQVWLDRNNPVNDLLEFIENEIAQALAEQREVIVKKLLEKVGIGDKGMYRVHLDCPNEEDMYAGIGYMEAKEDIRKIIASIAEQKP